MICMEFFTGNPQSVRGLGNILLDKNELDMLEYYSEVSVGSDSVFETVMPVYSMSYLDDSEDDMELPYGVNSFLLGAVKSVSVNDGKLDVNRYESSDLEVVTLRQLKHVLSGKVKDITYVDNVLRVVTFERSDLLGLQTKAAIVELLTNVVSDVRVVGNELVVDRWSAADVETEFMGYFGKVYYLMNDLTRIRANNPFSQSTLSLSSDWKITGEQSLKIVVGSSAQYFGIRTGANYLDIPDDIKGKTVRFSAYVNSPKRSHIRIFRHINNSWVSTNSTVIVPSGEQYAELTFTLESNADEFWFRLESDNNSWSSGDIIYTDSWTLEVLD